MTVNVRSKHNFFISLLLRGSNASPAAIIDRRYNTVSISVARFARSIVGFIEPVKRELAVLLLVLSAFLRRNVVVRPLQDDVRDLEVVRSEHHHVSRAVENRITELVEFD